MYTAKSAREREREKNAYTREEKKWNLFFWNRKIPRVRDTTPAGWNNNRETQKELSEEKED